MKIKYMTNENLMKKLEDLRTSYPKTDGRPAKGDESASLYAKHIVEELARRS
jgi:transposase